MIGAIVGDIVGSRFEFHPIKTKNFDLFIKNDCFDKNGKLTLASFLKGNRFTDDTVMTLAICKSLMDCKNDFTKLKQFTIDNMKCFGRKYPLVGYGFKFNNWLRSLSCLPYNSFGNGSAMRISAVPYFAKSLEEVKELSKIVTEVTHNHPEGLKGAEATAVCIWLALHNATKKEIKKYIEDKYYLLDYDYDNLVKNYKFNETCQNSVPQAIYGFLISNSYEDTLRTIVSMGGDCDTMGAIAGAIAEAFYKGVPKEIEEKANDYLDDTLLKVIKDFKLYQNEKIRQEYKPKK